MKATVLIFSLGLALLSSFSLSAQENRLSQASLGRLEAVEDSLGLLSYALVNDSLAENRFLAVRAFIPMLVNALKEPHSFDYPFSQLQAISIQYPADSSFRVLTWQLYVDKEEYRYYGAIQMNTPELQLFPLIDRSFELDGDLEQLVLSPEQWYGAVYYKIFTVTDGPTPHYLLFGFDGYSYFRKRKVIEVLTFADGQPVFGAPVFLAPDEATRKRFVLEYSVEASVSCNYNEAHEMILYDHLQTINGNYGEGPTQIPDGTYEGFVLKEGQWEYVEKVFNQILDEAPRPEPVLGGEKRDILGRGGR